MQPLLHHQRPGGLYSITKGQAAIIELTRAMRDKTGNLPSLPGVFPDTMAPIVRTVDGERELTMARWGLMSPQFVLKDRKTDPGVTNIRNTKSPHWRRWLRHLFPRTDDADEMAAAERAFLDDRCNMDATWTLERLRRRAW